MFSSVDTTLLATDNHRHNSSIESLDFLLNFSWRTQCNSFVFLICWSDDNRGFWVSHPLLIGDIQMEAYGVMSIQFMILEKVYRFLKVFIIKQNVDMPLSTGTCHCLSNSINNWSCRLNFSSSGRLRHPVAIPVFQTFPVKSWNVQRKLRKCENFIEI